jgi:hypothetical protein
MDEQSDASREFLLHCEEYLKSARAYLQSPDLTSIRVVTEASKRFVQIAAEAETDSFYLIAGRLEELFLRCSSAGTLPNKLELETVELAADWLDQLTVLYREKLPEPRSLVKELLYTFDLVERSQGALSLSELLSGENVRTTSKTGDPFEQDPELKSENYVEPTTQDPFGEDPGFGMAFDLLQRTMNLTSVPVLREEDPFTEDTSFDDEGTKNYHAASDSKLPFDVFSGDPSAEGKVDQD